MANARYVRLYADADGESHFSDEEMELRLVNFAPPAQPFKIKESVLKTRERQYKNGTVRETFLDEEVAKRLDYLT
jgi:hypothetical protein